MKPTSSATIPPKFNRSSGGVQKKVAGENSTRSRRSERPPPTAAQLQAHAHALTRAREIEATLSNENPSIIKSMVPSNVQEGYWMGIPKSFCQEHLPKVDTMIVLEDEDGREFGAKYLPRKNGLSGGWRRFSKDHTLQEHDVLVFHLVQPTKFRVYIIKLNEVDIALSLLRLDGGSDNQHDSVDVPQNDDSNNDRMICDDNSAPSNQLGNTSVEENLDLEVLNGNRLVRSMTNLQEISSIENFNIVVNGSVVDDSQLPQGLKTRYYDLCCSQKMILHENLLVTQNCQMVIGMIHEITTIADAIKASKITTPSHIFDLWYRKLKGLEILGMNVSFLLARLEGLMRLASKTKEYKEVRNHREQAEKEKKVLERKLGEVKKTIRRLDGQIDSLILNLQMLEAEFQGLTNAPW